MYLHVLLLNALQRFTKPPVTIPAFDPFVLATFIQGCDTVLQPPPLFPSRVFPNRWAFSKDVNSTCTIGRLSIEAINVIKKFKAHVLFNDSGEKRSSRLCCHFEYLSFFFFFFCLLALYFKFYSTNPISRFILPETF